MHFIASIMMENTAFSWRAGKLATRKETMYISLHFVQTRPAHLTLVVPACDFDQYN